MSEQESLTPSELAGALGRVKGLPLGIDMDVLARDLYADIKAHREPVYKQDDRIEDAQGVAWQRVPGNQWVRMGRVEWYDNDVPVRPLRKLVPEGSLAAKLSYEAVLGELASGMVNEEDYTQLAGRIMKLLDGAQ